jgi:hypothetical protein
LVETAQPPKFLSDPCRHQHRSSLSLLLCIFISIAARSAQTEQTGIQDGVSVCETGIRRWGRLDDRWHTSVNIVLFIVVVVVVGTDFTVVVVSNSLFLLIICVSATSGLAVFAAHPVCCKYTNIKSCYNENSTILLDVVVTEWICDNTDRHDVEGRCISLGGDDCDYGGGGSSSSSCCSGLLLVLLDHAGCGCGKFLAPLWSSSLHLPSFQAGSLNRYLVVVACTGCCGTVNGLLLFLPPDQAKMASSDSCHRRNPLYCVMFRFIFLLVISFVRCVMFLFISSSRIFIIIP